ncbi:MAG: hypothetical protein IJZ51_05395 [Ruminiclostridium sp.]|nr:hypothetical protein [Ruminiclostridium sp.]
MSVLEDVFKGSGLDKETHIAQRRELYSKDKSLLQDKNIVISPENIDTAENGRLTLQYKSTDYECFYYRKDTSDKLYVVFNGARKTGAELPVLKRWTYYSYIDGTLLNIADPMFRVHDKVKLGWYYGDDEDCYASRIAELAKIVAAKLGKKEIIFFGSSGGGFAALLAACNCVGSTAVVINPQIVPALWSYGKAFENLTGMSLTARDKFCRNHLPELIEESVYSKFLIINNMYSEEDNMQIDAMCRQFGKNVEYGMNKPSKNVLIWMYDAEHENPHFAMDYPMIFFAIDYLARHFDEAEQLSELYLIFGEMWSEHWQKIYASDVTPQLDTPPVPKENDSKGAGKVSVIADYAEGNSSLIQRLIAFEHCRVEATDSIWNNKCIYDRLQKNKTYKIEVENSVLSGAQEKFTLSMRDSANNELVMNFTLTAGENRAIIINTGNLSHSAKLKIYSGIVGKTQGVSLEADVSIYEIIVE